MEFVQIDKAKLCLHCRLFNVKIKQNKTVIQFQIPVNLFNFSNVLVGFSSCMHFIKKSKKVETRAARATVLKMDKVTELQFLFDKLG